MALQPIDLNHDDLDQLEERIVKTLREADASAGRIFLPSLGNILPSLSAVVPEELASFGALVDLFRHELKGLQTHGNKHELSYDLLERLSFLLWEYLGVFQDVLQDLHRAVAAWRIDLVADSQVQRLGGILARVRVLVEGVLKDSQRLDGSLRHPSLTVTQAPWLFRLRDHLSWTQRRLDLESAQNLKQRMRELEATFKQLHDQQRAYRALLTGAQRSLSNFQSRPYQIFLSLPEDTRRALETIYLYTKMDERNEREHKLPSERLEGVLRERLASSACLGPFEDYYEALDQALFEESRILKEQASKGELDEEEGRQTVELWLEARRLETKKLKFMIYRVREFQLRTDPDPYVHTRMGWHDRQLGPEPKETEPLQVLGRALRRLDNLFYRMSEAVHDFERSRIEAQWKQNVLLVGDIFSKIKELKDQDSEEEASQFANELLMKWSKLDEVCSFNKEDVSYDEFLLRKALLNDGFLVLQEKPRFREMLRQHLAIRGLFQDTSQRDRLDEMERSLALFQPTTEKLGAFLDAARVFLTGVQEGCSDTGLLEECRRQLLEFLVVYHSFCQAAEHAVLTSSLEQKWREISASLNELDGLFYKWEQGLLLGLRSSEET